MENLLAYQDMFRDTYSPGIITALQQKTSRLTGLVTHLPGCTGKRMEFNSMGKTEAGFREDEYEEKNPVELSYGKRCMLPIGFRHAIKFSSDWKLLKGQFAVLAPQFIDELTKSFARLLDQIVIGSKWDDAKKRWIVAEPHDAIDPKTSFYNAAGIGGILGPAYVGENLVTPETMPMQPMLKDGELASDYTDYDGKNLDIEKTSVIPLTYVTSGTPVISSLTPEKIMAIIEALQTRYAWDAGETINLAVPPSVQWALARDERFLSKENGFQMLKEGLISTLLGVRIVAFNNIPIVEMADGTLAYACPAWKMEDVYFGMWDDIDIEMVKPSMSYTKYVISGMGAAGCARKRNDTILTVLCAA